MVQAHKERIVNKKTIRRPFLYKGKDDTNFISTDGQITYEIRSVVVKPRRIAFESVRDCVGKIEKAYNKDVDSLADHYLFDLRAIPSSEKLKYQEQIKTDILKNGLKNNINNFDFIFDDD